MDHRVLGADNPCQLGKPLRGSLFKLWRYRVGDYRVIREIQDKRLVVLVAAVGLRSAVYVSEMFCPWFVLNPVMRGDAVASTKGFSGGREFLKRQSPAKRIQKGKGSTLVTDPSPTSRVQIPLRSPARNVARAREIAERKGIGPRSF